MSERTITQATIRVTYVDEATFDVPDNWDEMSREEKTNWLTNQYDERVMASGHGDIPGLDKAVQNGLEWESTEVWFDADSDQIDSDDFIS